MREIKHVCVAYLNLTFSRGSPQKILWWRRSPGGPASGSIRCPPVQVGGRSAREHVIGWMRVAEPRDWWNNFNPPLPEGHMIGGITDVRRIVIGGLGAFLRRPPTWLGDDIVRRWTTLLVERLSSCDQKIWGEIAVLRPRQDSLKID